MSGGDTLDLALVLQTLVMTLALALALVPVAL